MCACPVRALVLLCFAFLWVSVVWFLCVCVHQVLEPIVQRRRQSHPNDLSRPNSCGFGYLRRVSYYNGSQPAKKDVNDACRDFISMTVAYSQAVCGDAKCNHVNRVRNESEIDIKQASLNRQVTDLQGGAIHAEAWVKLLVLVVAEHAGDIHLCHLLVLDEHCHLVLLELHSQFLLQRYGAI